MEKIDKFYKKINGTYFLFLAIILQQIFGITAMIFYLSFDPTFSMATNWLSDLGTGPYGYIYNFGMIIANMMYILFFISLSRYLQLKGVKKNLNLICSIFGLGSAIGGILVGLFPIQQAGVMTWPHFITASIFFWSNLGFWMGLGVIEFSNSEFPKILAYICTITAIFFTIFNVFVNIWVFTSLFKTISILMEWLVVYSMVISYIIYGIYFLRNRIN